jgi:hypothetical protein
MCLSFTTDLGLANYKWTRFSAIDIPGTGECPSSVGFLCHECCFGIMPFGVRVSE